MENEETGDGFKPLLPMCKTSTPGPLRRATPASGGQCRHAGAGWILCHNVLLPSKIV